MSGVETTDLIEPWLYSTLSGDSQIVAQVGTNIFGALTPDEVSGVYITFAMLSLRDVRGVGQSRFSVDAIYMVKAVAQTTTQNDLIPTARRIDALLDGKDVDLTGGGHITCTRETIISHPQVISDAGQTRGGGQSFWHLGATWRIRANS